MWQKLLSRLSVLRRFLGQNWRRGEVLFLKIKIETRSIFEFSAAKILSQIEKNPASERRFMENLKAKNSIRQFSLPEKWKGLFHFRGGWAARKKPCHTAFEK